MIFGTSTNLDFTDLYTPYLSSKNPNNLKQTHGNISEKYLLISQLYGTPRISRQVKLTSQEFPKTALKTTHYYNCKIIETGNSRKVPKADLSINQEFFEDQGQGLG